MSLFAREGFEWRETYFILFNSRHRPTAASVVESLKNGSKRQRLEEVQADDDGAFEAVTVLSPDDCSAMDVTFMMGDEVNEQVHQLRRELSGPACAADAPQSIDKLKSCDARLDVYHFEQVSDYGEDDDGLDPGSLLIVLKRLAKLCHGVCIDPQSGTMLF